MSFDLGSPFKTPSKSKPAIIFQEISDLSFTNHFIEQQEEEIPDEEIAKVDEMLDVHDTDEDEDLIHEKSTIIFDDDEEIPDSSHTPRFTPRKAAFIARRESQGATVIELTKLVKQMKDDSDDARSTNSKISTVLLLVVVLVAILFASSNRPYCNEYSWYPCQQCPRNAECSLFSIQSCLSPNYTVHDNQVCIRNDSTGLFSYRLAHIAKDYLDSLAYRVDCLGNSKISKKVHSDKLYDILFEKTLKEFTKSKPETTFTHGFNTMISLFEDNEDVFRIALESDQTFISSRYQSLGSCLITKHHFKPYNYPRNITITESTNTSMESSSPDQSTDPSATLANNFPNEETVKPLNVEENQESTTTTPTTTIDSSTEETTATTESAPSTQETTTTTESEISQQQPTTAEEEKTVENDSF